jgi:fructokinase
VRCRVGSGVRLQKGVARSPKQIDLNATGWPAIVSLGEVLVDFVALDDSLPLEHAAVFQRAAGGAPANVAVALVRLGAAVGFVGKVGGDAFGRTLRETLATEGVDVRGLLDAPGARTALAFVGADARGGRRFEFYHERTAHTLLQPEEVDRDLIAHARIFHFGSVTLAAEPSRSATSAAARWARQGGQLVSFDPNVRLELWDSPGRARSSIVDILSLVDVVKVSSDELEFLTGASDPAAACRILCGYGPRVAIATLGSSGCYYQTSSTSGYVLGVEVDAVDSLGAGDAFVAGFLATVALSPATILRDADALVSALRFANAVGAITTTKHGAIPALPTRAQVERLLNARGGT